MGTNLVLPLLVVDPRSVISKSPEVDVLEPQGEHFASPHARVEGGNDHRAEHRSRGGQQLPFLRLGQSSPALIVLVHLANQRLRSTAERRAIEVLATDRPVHHVPQQLDVAIIDAGDSGRPRVRPPVRGCSGPPGADFLRSRCDGRRKSGVPPRFWFPFSRSLPSRRTTGRRRRSSSTSRLRVHSCRRGHASTLSQIDRTLSL